MNPSLSLSKNPFDPRKPRGPGGSRGPYRGLPADPGVGGRVVDPALEAGQLPHGLQRLALTA